MEWWGTRQSVSPLLERDVRFMRETFGKTFKLQVPTVGTQLYWLGVVQINMTSVRQREHTMKILYPTDYPNRPPEAYVLHPKVWSKKHQYEDGQLCLFNPKDGQAYGWNPAKSTVVTVAGWGIEWMYAFYTFQAMGVWPGEEERVAR